MEANGIQSKGHVAQQVKQTKNNVRTKEYCMRNSLLDDLMENHHILTAYRLFLALLLGLSVHLATYEYFNNGKINFGQRLIIEGFSGFHKFIVLWTIIFSCNLPVYYGFKYWATTRISLSPKAVSVKFLDYVFTGALVVYLHGFLLLATWLTYKTGLSIFLTSIASFEITRLVMKFYAFVRSNVPRVLKYKPHQDEAAGAIYPTFNQFMYYLFVPAPIYRDSYPRMKCIRWKFVAVKMVEFLGGVLLVSVTTERFIIAPFRDYGIKPYSWSDLGILFTQSALMGFVLSVTLNYLVLHVWLNAFAEILRFGDRLFYQDWWTAPNFEKFYQKWNVVVHDWLYTYVYKDFYETVFPGNKVAAKYAVFLLSSLFHEYILYTAFGFGLPIVFVQFFCISTIFTFIKFKPEAVGNVVILYGLGLGNGANFMGYGLEYFARLNCPVENATIGSFFKPRMLSCGGE